MTMFSNETCAVWLCIALRLSNKLRSIAFCIGPFLALRLTLDAALLWPSVAVFMYSGLAAGGFESLPIKGFFNKKIFSSNLYDYGFINRENYHFSELEGQGVSCHLIPVAQTIII